MNPMDSITSLLGLSSWCGGTDMWHLLDEHFGDMTMGELKHKVLIMTFDMSSGAEDQPRNGWSARIFHNFLIKGNSLDEKVSLVAYAAACPVTVRPVVQGLTDGCIFAMSPTLPAYSQLTAIARKKADIMDVYEKETAYDSDELPPQTVFLNALGSANEKGPRQGFNEHLDVLNKITI